MKKLIFALVTVLALTAGCAKEKLNGSIGSHSGISEVTATTPGTTRAYFHEEEGGTFSLYWLKDQSISVGAESSFLVFDLVEGADTPVGKFKSVGGDMIESDFYYAVSPDMVGLKTTDGALTLSYPSTLNYRETTGFTEDGEVMVSKVPFQESGEFDFQFESAVGYIKFQLSVETSETIRSMFIQSKEGKLLNGSATASFNDNNTLKEIKFNNGGDSELRSVLTVRFLNDITITPEKPFVTYIPVAPVLSDGFTVFITMKSGKAMKIESSQAVTRGKITEIPMTAFDPLPVAEVDGQQYESISEAITAANDGNKDVTIKLLEDCPVGDHNEVNSSREITLDLNGHTLSSVGDIVFSSGEGNHCLVITDNTTAQKGKIVNSTGSDTPINIYGNTILRGGNIISEEGYGVTVMGGCLTVEGGAVEGGAAGLYIKPEINHYIDSVVLNGTGKITSASGNAIVHNVPNVDLICRAGSVYSTKAGIYVYDGNLKIYDGEFGAKSNVIYASRSSSYKNQVDIYGGLFHRDSTTNSIIYGHATTDSTRIVGGYYNVGPSASYVQDGYVLGACDETIEGIRYTSTIVEGAEVQATVQVGSGAPVDKATPEEAFATALASNEPSIITLVSNSMLSDSIPLPKCNITLDLNGYTLVTPGTCVFRLNDPDANLTIKSSREGGMTFESSTNSNSLIIRAGKCTLESGCLKGINASSGHVYVKGGEFIMNGGEIYTPTYNGVSLTEGTFTMNGGTIRTDKEKTYAIKGTGGKLVLHGGTFVTPTPGYQVSLSTNEAEINGELRDLAISGAGKYNITGGKLLGMIRSDATDVTVDGAEFYNDSTVDGAATCLYVTGGNVTIKNTKLTGNCKSGTIKVSNGGNVTIDEGTTVTTTTDYYALYAGDSNGAGSISVKGGTINAPSGAYAYQGFIEVSGGTFNVDNRVAKVGANGTVEVTGGYFNKSVGTAPHFDGENTEGLVQGGWFSQSIDANNVDNASMIDESTPAVVEGVEYKYHVVENPDAPYIIDVNGTQFRSINNAIKAAYATEGEVLFRILSNCKTMKVLTIEGNRTFTIDLNGHKLEASVVSTCSDFVLTDKSESANGSLEPAEGVIPVKVNAGKTTIAGGKIVGNKACGLFINGDKTNKATCDMTGGYILSSLTNNSTDFADNGGVSVYNNSEFNMTGGTAETTTYRGLWVRTASSSDSHYAVANIKGGTIIGKTYALYTYTRGHLTVEDGIIIATSGRVCHNGTSNTAVDIKFKGGYYYGTNSTNFISGFNATSCSKYNISGGYYSKNPVTASSNKISVVGKVTTVSPAIEKKVMVSGVETTYSFGFQVTK